MSTITGVGKFTMECGPQRAHFCSEQFGKGLYVQVWNMDIQNSVSVLQWFPVEEAVKLRDWLDTYISVAGEQ